MFLDEISQIYYIIAYTVHKIVYKLHDSIYKKENSINMEVQLKVFFFFFITAVAYLTQLAGPFHQLGMEVVPNPMTSLL